MKKFISFILFLTICQFSFAQSKDSIAVASAVESMRVALVDADKIKLDQLLSRDLSYGHSSGKIDTKQSLEEALTTGVSDFLSIELSEQTIKILGDNAIVRHKLFAKTIDGGKPAEIKLSVLLVWKKNQHQWQLIARQAVKIS